MYLSGVCCFCISSDWIVLLVHSAIFRSVILNRLVTKVVSLPTYVKVVHFCGEPDQPIRPVVNWRRVPTYKLARCFTHKIRLLAPLPNKYNLDNTTDLIKKLHDTPILPHFAMASLDITNLYTNVPVKETKKIIAKNLEENQLVPQTRWN